MPSIRLSPKHGVNPSLSVCFFCGGDKNEIVLPGMLRGDAEAPRKAVWNHEPCDQCAGYMEQGIIFIGVDESRTDDPKNPYRTGKFAVIREEAVRRLVQPEELLESILKARVAFIPDDAWKALRLP